MDEWIFSCQLILIFESLEMILLRTASDLSHFSMVGNAIVKKTVSGYMKLLQSSLHSTNHRLLFLNKINILSVSHTLSLIVVSFNYIRLMFCFCQAQVCSSVPQFPDCFGVSGSRGCSRGSKLHSRQ